MAVVSAPLSCMLVFRFQPGQANHGVGF